MVNTYKLGVIQIAKKLHIGMVHTIAKGALFFKRLFCCIVAIVAV